MRSDERKHDVKYKRGGVRMHESERKHDGKSKRSGAEIVNSIKYRIP